MIDLRLRRRQLLAAWHVLLQLPAYLVGHHLGDLLITGLAGLNRDTIMLR